MSRATRRALGTASTLAPGSRTTAAGAAPFVAGADAEVAAGAAAGAGAAAAPPPAVARWKMTLPTGTVSPAATRIFEIVPAAGAGTSTVALSVMTSTTA